MKKDIDKMELLKDRNKQNIDIIYNYFTIFKYIKIKQISYKDLKSRESKIYFEIGDSDFRDFRKISFIINNHNGIFINIKILNI